MLAPVAVALVGLLALAVAALALLRRFGNPFPGTAQARRLKLVERLAVSRRSALLLVELDGRTLLLGQSGEQLSLLQETERCEPKRE
jgi:flagellar biosynthetic protein FliO